MRSNRNDHQAGERRNYEVPRLVDEGRLVEVTTDVADLIEDDGGNAPFDRRDPAGSVGFSL